MAAYSYKRVRDLLIESGYLNKYGDPVNKTLYGDYLDPTPDGNLWEIVADYIESLKSVDKDIVNH